jgi:hypothetical protein
VLGLVVAALAAASRLPQPTYSASTQVLIGEPAGLASASPQLYTSVVTARAQTLADMTASPEVRQDIARAAGLPAAKIAIDEPLWGDLQRIQQWDTGEKRSYQIVAEQDPYRLTLTDNFTAPVVDVSAQGPSGVTASQLAGAVAPALRAYLAGAAAAAHTPPADRIVVTQLAPVAIDSGSGAGTKNVAGFTFVAVFLLWCGVVLLVGNVHGDIRVLRRRPQVPKAPQRFSRSRAGWPRPTGISTPAE